MRTWRVLRWALGAVAVAAFIYFVMVPLAGTFETVGIWLAETVGLVGVFFYVYIVDTVILPASVDILFPFVLTWSPVPLLAVVGVASFLGGCSGYLIGHNLNRLTVVARLTKIETNTHVAFIARYGMWGVIVAALLPMPFSTVSWLAGMVGLDPVKYVYGALFRIPRMIATFFLLRESVILLS
ncbi:MAG: hypothetical protein ABR590_02580 [Spirochaetia bacterium]